MGENARKTMGIDLGIAKDRNRHNAHGCGCHSNGRLLQCGARWQLRILNLAFNTIGPKGMGAFSGARRTAAAEDSKPRLQRYWPGRHGRVVRCAEKRAAAAEDSRSRLQQYWPERHARVVRCAGKRCAAAAGDSIGAEGMGAFSAALKNGELQQLDTLNLASNDIGAKGMVAFCSAQTNTATRQSNMLPNLDTLILSFNNIDDEAMAAFSNTRRERGLLKGLEYLDVSGTNLNTSLMVTFPFMNLRRLFVTGWSEKLKEKISMIDEQLTVQ